MRELMTTAEAADYLRCSARTITKYCREGKLKYRKIGRGYLIEANELRRFLGEPVARPIPQEAPEGRFSEAQIRRAWDKLQSMKIKEASHGTRKSHTSH